MSAERSWHSRVSISSRYFSIILRKLLKFRPHKKTAQSYILSRDKTKAEIVGSDDREAKDFEQFLLCLHPLPIPKKILRKLIFLNAPISFFNLYFFHFQMKTSTISYASFTDTTSKN